MNFPSFELLEMRVHFCEIFLLVLQIFCCQLSLRTDVEILALTVLKSNYLYTSRSMAWVSSWPIYLAFTF